MLLARYVSPRENYTTTIGRVYTRLSLYFEPNNRVVQLAEVIRAEKWGRIYLAAPPPK